MKVDKIKLTEEERIQVSTILTETDVQRALVELFGIGLDKGELDSELMETIELANRYAEAVEKIVEKYSLEELEETF